jgi:hypothetical protein
MGNNQQINKNEQKMKNNQQFKKYIKNLIFKNNFSENNQKKFYPKTHLAVSQNKVVIVKSILNCFIILNFFKI